MEKSGSLLNTPLGNTGSVVERIIHQLTEAIISGELKPGQQIPTEMELNSALHVSRNSIREAIKVLTHFGVFEIRRAEGTFVSNRFNKRMLDPMLYGLILQKDSAKDILELREVFDIGILKLVIDLYADTAKTAIKEAYDKLESAITCSHPDAQEVLNADIAFHGVITSSIHNKLLDEVAGYIDRITIPSRILTMQMILDTNHQLDFLNLHTEIVKIIENKESEQVMSVVKEHYQFWRITQDKAK